MKAKIYTSLFFIALVHLPIIAQTPYYKDLTANIVQTPSVLGAVSDIQSAFNNARTKENQQLGTSLPQLTFPANWGSLALGERAAWILKKERADRGLLSFTGTDPNVVSVAQSYADYLLKNNKFGHNADGSTPQARLNQNAVIGKCNDPVYAYENLFVKVSSATADILYELEYGIYTWLYNDAGSAWGHRRCLLQTNFTDNSGATGEEGLFGIGVASGGPYKGDFSQSWNYAEIVVFNVIDPCASWVYTTDIEVASKSDNYNLYYDGSKIQLDIALLANTMDVEVFNMLGENVYINRYDHVQGRIAIDDAFKPGIYIVRVSANNQSSYSRKIAVN